MKQHTTALLALILVLAACTPDAGESSSTSAGSTDTSTTSTTASVRPSTSTATNGRTVETVRCDDAPDEISIVCEVFDLIQDRYVDDVDGSKLAEFATIGVSDLDGTSSETGLVCALPTPSFADPCAGLPDKAETSTEGAEAIVRGMASALDPNSVYLDEESVELIEEEQQGQIEGIGALVTAEDSTTTDENPQCSIISATCELIIVSVISDSPAEASGIQKDDRIIGVNGDDIDGWTIDEVTATVRGPAGSDVLLTMLREDETFDVSITRAAVVIPVVDSAVYDSVGYVKLNVFSDNADEQLEEAITELLESHIDELVFDLTNNPGGLLDTSIEVVSLFLPDGDVVVTEGPNDNRTFEVSGDPLVPDDIPITIIVNKGSASASEVVSAVLQERGRALVVGENSFGKNTVQQRFSLSNGGAFKLTIARWLTPDGLDFGGTGVTPDIEVEFSSELDQEAVAELAASFN